LRRPKLCKITFALREAPFQENEFAQTMVGAIRLSEPRARIRRTRASALPKNPGA
jgi:hypothetical protein